MDTVNNGDFQKQERFGIVVPSRITLPHPPMRPAGRYPGVGFAPGETVANTHSHQIAPTCNLTLDVLSDALALSI